MSVFPSWPWTNFHEMNLDWLIKKVKYIEEHLEEIVVDATSDMLDDTLTNPDKAAQAKAAGDAIRGNAADIASLNTTVQGITNNVTNLTTRVTRNEGTINNLLAADTSMDHRITALNSRYEGTYQDVITLQSAVRHAETEISDLSDTLDGADEALSDRITALEGTVNAVKDYVFTIYEYDGANDPLYICTMEESPNGINSLLSDLNGRIPVNVKAIINYGGITGSRVANLTTVRVGGEIHGVEFDAGDFHCRFLDSNTMGTAYFNKVYLSVNWTTSTATLVKGNCDTLKHYTPQITITDSGNSYIPIFIDHSHEESYIKVWYMDQVEDVTNLGSRYIQVNVDDSAQVVDSTQGS